jgi:hypothetical protein
MADDVVRLPPDRWAALVGHIDALDPANAGHDMIEVEVRSPIRVGEVTYLPAVYVLDGRVTGDLQS